LDSLKLVDNFNAMLEVFVLWLFFFLFSNSLGLLLDLFILIIFLGNNDLSSILQVFLPIFIEIKFGRCFVSTIFIFEGSYWLQALTIVNESMALVNNLEVRVSIQKILFFLLKFLLSFFVLLLFFFIS